MVIRWCMDGECIVHEWMGVVILVVVLLDGEGVVDN